MSVTSYISKNASGQEYEVTAISTDNLTIKQLDNPNGGGLKTALAAATNVRRRWRFYDLFDAAPGTSPYATGKGLLSDEIHVVVFDRTGDISGFRADTNGERTQSVLETFPFVSVELHPLKLHRWNKLLSRRNLQSVRVCLLDGSRLTIE